MKEALNHDREPLHTGDDERIDLVTGIIAAAEGLRDEDGDDVVEVAEGILEDCRKLDALLVETIQREAGEGRAPQHLQETAWQLVQALQMRWNNLRVGTDEADDADFVEAFLRRSQWSEGRAPQGWQPIETLPTGDGWFVGLADSVGVCCRRDDVICEIAFDRQDRSIALVEALRPITHWWDFGNGMPLPAPPGTGQPKEP